VAVHGQSVSLSDFEYRWASLLMDSGVLSLNYAARSLAGHSSVRILETIENVQDITQILAL
jgi:hypothetical protein